MARPPGPGRCAPNPLVCGEPPSLTRGLDANEGGRRPSTAHSVRESELSVPDRGDYQLK